MFKKQNKTNYRAVNISSVTVSVSISLSLLAIVVYYKRHCPTQQAMCAVNTRSVSNYSREALTESACQSSVFIFSSHNSQQGVTTVVPPVHAASTL